MEERPCRYRFFFANAIERFDSLLRFAKIKFTNLWGSGRGTEHSTPERSFTALVAEGHDNRYVELVWLAGDDPLKIEHLERMPLIDYWHLLNRKYAAAQKAANEQAKIRSRIKRK